MRGARGKAHLSPDDHNSIILASKQAIRMVLTLSGQTIKNPLDSNSPLWLLELKLLNDDDVLQSALAVNSLLYELEANPKRMIISHELFNMISALSGRIKKFEEAYSAMRSCSRDLKESNRALVRAKRKFNAELLEVTHHGMYVCMYVCMYLCVNVLPVSKGSGADNEDCLDIPLDYYLKENDMLRKANDARNKATIVKNRVQDNFLTSRGSFDTSFACIRSLSLLVARALSMYAGLYLDTTSLIPLGTDTLVPTTCHVSAALHPIIFGGNSTTPDNNASQRGDVVNRLLRGTPWDKLASVAVIERQVSGTVTTRILAAVACKLSDMLQCRLAPWAFRAIYDITHEPRYRLPVLSRRHFPHLPLLIFSLDGIL